MKRLPFWILLTIVMNACTGLPSMAIMLNERPEGEVVNVNENGFIAFSPDGHTKSEMKIDVKNITTGKVFRLNLTPDFSNNLYFGVGPIKIAEKQLDLGMNKSVVIYQLPPGDYVFKYAYIKGLQKTQGSPIPGYPFTIESRVITSFGELSVEGKLGLLGQVESINIRTVKVDIKNAISGFDLYGIPDLRVQSRELEISK